VLIRIGYNIVLRLFEPSPVIFLLRIHPSRDSTLVVPEAFQLEPDMPVDYYFDSFGNQCGRLNAPAGTVHFRNQAVVWDSGEPDTINPMAEHDSVCQTSEAALTFLLPGRYCEVDSELMAFAWKNLGRLLWGGVESRRFVISSINKFASIMSKRDRIAQR